MFHLPEPDIFASKWDTLDNSSVPDPPTLSEVSTDGSFDNDPRDLDEEKRSRLKKIEVKVLQYQDELESGARQLRPGWTIDKQIQHYRRKLTKLMKKSEFQRDDSESPGEKYFSSRKDKRSPSPSEQSARKSRKSKRSPSPLYSKSSRRRSRDSVSPTRSFKSKRPRSRSYTSPRHRSDKHRKHKY